MPSYSGPSSARSGEIAGTLRLLVALTLAITLMVLDHRGGWLTMIRGHVETLAQPLWRLAGLPGRLGDTVRDGAATRSQLAKENETLRNALLVSGARIARLQAAADENARLRGLLGATQRGGLDVQLAPILDVSLDPTRQRLMLDVGANQGVEVGQPAIDAGGVLGQVIEVHPSTATVLLLTDLDHAIPVAVSRSGIRLVAYGRGDRLELANVPTSSDVKIGDQIVTSGLGGRFPPGFPVGTITRLRRDESRAFLVGDLKPAAQLDRGRDVLLLRQVPMSIVSTPVPAPAAADAIMDSAAGNKPQPASQASAVGAEPTPDASSAPNARRSTAPTSQAPTPEPATTAPVPASEPTPEPTP